MTRWGCPTTNVDKGRYKRPSLVCVTRSTSQSPYKFQTSPLQCLSRKGSAVFAFVSRFRFLRFQCVEIRMYGVTVGSGKEGRPSGRQLNPRWRNPPLCLLRFRKMSGGFFPSFISQCVRRLERYERRLLWS